MKKYFVILILLLCLAVVLNCDQKKPKDDNGDNGNGPKPPDTTTVEKKQFTEDQFVDYYVQVSILQEKYADKPDTLSSKIESLQYNLGITDTDIENFRKNYKDDTEKWEELWNRIETEINEKKSTL